MRKSLQHFACLLSLPVLLGCDQLLAGTDGGTSPDGGESTPALTVTVNLSSPVGPVRDVFGVNKTPRLALKSGGAVDATRLYTAFGVSQVRMHDVGISPCSLYKDATVRDPSVSPPRVVTGCNFPDIVKRRSWTVNDPSKVDDPANYDFSEVDALLAAASRTGARIYLRIGANDFGGPNDTEDVTSFARVSVNLYRHVIGQFKPGPTSYDPAYVEVGNEPDGAFWRGDAADFISAYNLMVDGVRAAAAQAGKTVQVGGAGFTKEVLAKFSEAGNVANGFAAGVTAGRLEFFSAHHYDDCSAATLSNAATFLTSLRAQLKSQGLASVPLHLTEWNIGLGNKCDAGDFSSPQSQSFASGVLSLLQEESWNVQAAHFYAGMPPMSLFESGGATGTVGINVSPSAWALRAHSGLKGGTRLLTQVCEEGTCSPVPLNAGAPLMAVAVKRATAGYRVIVTNDSDEEKAFTLKFTGTEATGVNGATVRRPPSSSVAVEGTVTNGAFTPTDASVSAVLATEVASPVTFTASGLDRVAELTIAARSLLVVDVP